jgi:hypothetical protein
MMRMQKKKKSRPFHAFAGEHLKWYSYSGKYIGTFLNYSKPATYIGFSNCTNADTWKIMLTQKFVYKCLQQHYSK